MRLSGQNNSGLLRIHQYTIMSAPTTAQAAALEALQCGERHVLEMTAEYDRRRKLIVNGLNIWVCLPLSRTGAFYAFPKIAIAGMDEETFARNYCKKKRWLWCPALHSAQAERVSCAARMRRL